MTDGGAPAFVFFPNLEEELQHKGPPSQEEMQIWSGNTNKRTKNKQQTKKKLVIHALNRTYRFILTDLFRWE